MHLPEINKAFAYGASASAPALTDVLDAWKAITAAVDPWLDALTHERLEQAVVRIGKPTNFFYGNLVQRVIYHDRYHTGENMAIPTDVGTYALAAVCR